MKVKKRLSTTSILHDLSRVSIATLMFSAFGHPAIANPEGGTVNAGSANITSSGSNLDIYQNSDKVVIDWRKFDINVGETTQFHQLNSSSIALNRVGGNTPSQIFGRLIANGNVIIINPNGVLFGKGAKVDVNGLVASTADITNENFMSGNMKFDKPGNPNASIINEGSITAQQAGLVGLVAPNVTNDGIITAKLGKVQLASGDAYTLDMYGDGLMEIKVSDAVKSQLVSNTGKIIAAGGAIELTAAAGRETVNSLINVQGELKAPSFKQKNGKIIISAEGANKTNKSGSSIVVVNAKINASGKKHGQTGGSVDILADNVNLTGGYINVSGDAGGGKVRIGGDFHGEGATPTAITTSVADGVTINASALQTGNGGDVTVWSDAQTDFLGHIKADGGALSGNGGNVETSGHVLHAFGTVDASAPNGVAGNWLLDPFNVTIAAGAGTDTNAGCSGSPQNCAPTADATIFVNNLNATLSGGTSVTITTGSSGASNGDITVNGAINESYAGTVGLTLSAYRNIIFGSGIGVNASAGKLNLVLDSDASGNITNGGYILLNTATFNTNGGDIYLGGGALNGSNLPSGSAYGNSGQAYGVYIKSSTVNANGGYININGTGNQNTSGSGMFGVYIDASTVKTSGNGNLDITATGGKGSSGNNRGLYLINTTTVQIDSGTMNIIGTGGNTAGGTNHGIAISATGTPNGFKAVGTGTLNITGYGMGTGSDNYGLKSDSLTNFITGAGGTVNVTGTGSTTSTSANNYGLFLGLIISNTLNGNINITGTGGGTGASSSNYGVDLNNASSIRAVGGATTITGIGGSGSGGSNFGYVTATGANAVGNGSTTGDITLIADNVSLAGSTTFQTTGNIFVHPYTPGTAMNIGSNSGGLQLTDTSLGYFNWGSASSLQLGDATNTGAMNINTALTYTKNVKFQTKSGSNITLAGQLKSSKSGNAFTLASGGNFINSVGSTAFNLSGGGNWLIYSANPSSDTINSLASNYRRFSCTYGGSCPTLGTGNGFLYTTTPILTITPSTQNATYGDATPALSGYAYGVTGYLGSDSGSDALSGSLTGSTTYAQGNNVGSYNINYASGSLASAMGYGFTYANNASALSVAARILTITPDSGQSKIYGAADPTLTYTISSGSLYGSDSLSGVLGRATGENVSTYAINQNTLTAGSNYAITFTGGRTFAITPYTLNVTAAAKSKTYGDVDPTLTYTFGTLQNGDSSTVFTGALSRVAGENVGNYAINQGSLSAGGNYTINYTGANLGITAAALTVNATAKTKTYGDIDPALTYTFSGLTNGDTSSVFTGALSRAASENVGSYAISQNTLSAGSNYTITYTGANLGITAAALTVNATAKTKTYGDADPTLTYTYSGLTNGDTASVFTGVLARDVGENVGNYAINQNGLSAGGNYTITYNTANLSVTPAALTVTANNKTKIYGDSNPTFDLAFSGLTNGDSSSVFTGYTLTNTATAASNVGSYAINLSGGSASNYTITRNGGILSVTPAALTITADNQSKLVGDINPAYTVSYSGFKNSDDTSVLSGLAVASAATISSPAGNYNIIPSGATAMNYNISFVNGVLTIGEPPPPPVVIPDTVNRVSQQPTIIFQNNPVTNPVIVAPDTAVPASNGSISVTDNGVPMVVSSTGSGGGSGGSVATVKENGSTYIAPTRQQNRKILYGLLEVSPRLEHLLEDKSL